MGSHRCADRLIAILLLALVCLRVSSARAHEFAIDGKVIELDESNFDSAISAFDYILIDFYAPWCGHCKKLAPELDKAAPILSSLKQPVAIAKINADKYRKFASKYEIDGFPTLKIFMHGIPTEYRGPRKSDLLVKFLKKFVAPDVTILEQDPAIHDFIASAGTHFPIFVGFGLVKSMLTEFGKKYKAKAWFSVAKEFSEELMATYDFDKAPALVSLHPKYDQHDVFYGPFEEGFLEAFIKQNLLPLTVPMNYDTMKLLVEDKRQIVLAVVQDEFNEEALQLRKILSSAASANRDLVFAYVGVKQWEEFAESFEATRKNVLPKILIWDGRQEYYIVEGLETLKYGEDQSSQVSRFLQAFREGKLVQKKFSGPSFTGFLKSLMNIRTLVVALSLVALIVSVLFIGRESEEPPRRRSHPPSSASEEAAWKEKRQSEDKED